MDNFRWGRFLAVKFGGLFDPSGEGYPPLRIRKEDFRGIGAEEGSPSFHFSQPLATRSFIQNRPITNAAYGHFCRGCLHAETCIRIRPIEAKR